MKYSRPWAVRLTRASCASAADTPASTPAPTTVAHREIGNQRVGRSADALELGYFDEYQGSSSFATNHSVIFRKLDSTASHLISPRGPTYAATARDRTQGPASSVRAAPVHEFCQSIE